MKNLIFGSLIIPIYFIVVSFTKQPESYYQDKFSIFIKGTKEFKLDDNSRIDIVTDTFAIECDFAARWAEGVGQSLFYAEKTGKKAGVLIIVNGNKEPKIVDRVMTVAMKNDITVWLWDYNTDICKRVKVLRSYSF